MSGRYYSMQDVCLMFGVTRTTIIRWSDPKSGCGFPQRVQLGRISPSASRTRYGAKFMRRSNCRVGFVKAEVDDYIQARENNRLPPKEDDGSDES